jgi:hypothetical protein
MCELGHIRCITLLKAGGPNDNQAPTTMAAAIDVRFMWSSFSGTDWGKTAAFDRTGEFGLGAKSIAGPFGRMR